MTADDSIKYRCVNSGMTDQVGGFQSRGVCKPPTQATLGSSGRDEIRAPLKTPAWEARGLSASVSFLSSPLPPRSLTCAIFRAVFDSCSSFFAPKPHRNACYAGWCKGSTFVPPQFVIIIAICNTCRNL